MEQNSRERLAEHFPDLADDLAAVVPDAGAMLRVEDAWVAVKHAEGSRLRAVDIAAGTGGPTVSDLLAQGRARAVEAGWRQIDREDHEQRDVFRRTRRGEREAAPEYLRLWPSEVDYPGASARAARFDVEQHCPWSRMEAALTDRMIQTLVRQQWKLGQSARSVRIEVLFDPDDLAEALVLRERMELPTTETLLERIEDRGLELVGRSRDRYARVERFTKGELTTAVALDDELAIIVLELNRTRRLR